MLNKLMGSKSRVKILSLFFGNENKDFYVQQVIKMAEVDSANTHRELLKLKKIGILKSKKKGNQKYYSLNKKYEFYQGLKKLFEEYNEKYGGEEWTCLEEMPNYYPMMIANALCSQSVKNLAGLLGVDIKLSATMATYKDNYCGLYCIKKEFNKSANELIKRMIDDHKIGLKFNELLRNRAGKLIDINRELEDTNFKALSDKQLAKLFKKANDIYGELHELHWAQTFLDFEDNLYSKHLMNFLKSRINDKEDSIGEVFSILTTPTEESNASLEYRDLLKILKEIEKNEEAVKYFNNTDTRIISSNLGDKFPKINTAIEKHSKTHGYLGYNTVGPAWGKDYFIDILGSLIRQKRKATDLLKKFNDDKKNLKKKQLEYIKKYKINKKDQELFEIARNMVHTKGLRKDSMFHHYCASENFYREIGRRHYITVQQVRYLHPHEIYDLLMGKKIDTSVTNKRYKFSVYYSTGHYEKDKFIIGKEAEEFLDGINIIEEEIGDISILQGDTASPGRVRGKVSVVNVIEDMEKMEKGNILISIATTPDLVPAIKQAGAIVTDMGGITCHAAIVSREFGIPCVIGTKIATKVLKDGDVLDVDATHGKVNILEKK